MNSSDNKTNKLIVVTHDGCPDLLSLHSKNSQRYPFLLQSTSADNKNSRFDILFAFPQQRLILKSNSTLFVDNEICDQNDFLNELDALWGKEEKNTDNEFNLPFIGGWFIYLAYEFLGQIEGTVNTHKLEHDIAIAVRIPTAIIYDRHNNKSYIIAEKKYGEFVRDLTDDLKSIKDHKIISSKLNCTATVQEEESDLYFERITRAKKYIFDGDIFQSNLSREWVIQKTANIKSIDLYNKLRVKSPAAFSGIVQFNDFSIISSSPERLIRVKDGCIETRPIAGTSQRAENKLSDTELAKKLLNHPKEKAEHVMLIDMERNDLGRVCEPGSVDVNEMMVIESIEHVHHIISNIKGKLRKNTTPGTIIKAVFPGGSITGCPKVRCMEIIYELEEKARNSYTGSMGYLNNNGDMDLNILIRTIEMTDESITFRTGAGIVNDSIANSELQETRIKAKGMLAALS